MLRRLCNVLGYSQSKSASDPSPMGQNHNGPIIKYHSQKPNNKKPENLLCFRTPPKDQIGDLETKMAAKLNPKILKFSQ